MPFICWSHFSHSNTTLSHGHTRHRGHGGPNLGIISAVHIIKKKSWNSCLKITPLWCCKDIVQSQDNKRSSDHDTSLLYRGWCESNKINLKPLFNLVVLGLGQQTKQAPESAKAWHRQLENFTSGLLVLQFHSSPDIRQIAPVQSCYVICYIKQYPSIMMLAS